jgi:hypothetical protein
MYENQLVGANDSVEEMSIKYEMNKHLKAFDNGEDYKVSVPKPIECVGCSA